MENSAHRAIAIVGVGAILPDAPNATEFWNNIKAGRYSISDVTSDRWDPEFYYDADPAAPDKTYSKIGGWVREYAWDPMKWKLPVPPRVADAMDPVQKWAVACTREALEDYGYPKRPLDLDRTAVIIGNAMAGEKHYLSSLRVFFPEYAHELAETAAFASLPESVREQITKQFHDRMSKRLQPITEDSMPGELANCMAGRIANLYNFHGPNFVCDAACASAMAAITAAVEGLVQNEFDVVVTGGADRNMGAPTFVKFCKIGALSATGTRPYAQGADGFVMGEGAAIFILKRLADAERNGDKIYAVLRGISGASDGKGKGITAPNPVGQKLCVERAWQNAGLSAATATLIEGHGTSTKVGDVVEAQSMVEVLSSTNLPTHSVALGSVKSNIGHLKGAAGAAGILKTAFALRDKVLPPSLHCEKPSPDIDFAHSPLFVNTELKPWDVPTDVVRRAGVSAFGFGGTNFHVVMEEHIPGKLNGNGKKTIAVPEMPPVAVKEVVAQAATVAPPTVGGVSAKDRVPLRGALVVGAPTEAELIEKLKAAHKAAQAGEAPAPAKPAESDLRAAERIAIDYADAAELATKAAAALKAFQANTPAFWKALRAQGIFRGHGPTPKVAFLYTGQGSQYVNMTRTMRDADPIVAETFAEADRIMTPLLGKPLTEFIFVDPKDASAVAKAEDDLRQTAITQPAVITTDLAMTRLLAAYGIEPDMTMGHSVGEYGALTASGALPFEDALEAVSARGREMTRVSMADNGKMAAVFAPISEVEKILQSVKDYVVIANINSTGQSVIGGATKAVEQAAEIFLKAGFNVVELPVSHAFHTSIVAPASEPLRQMLKRLRLSSPKIPIVANLTGEFYATGPDVAPQMVDILAQQVAAPVQFVKGLRTLYDAGARVFVEVGPKKALQGFAEDVLGANADVLSLFTNHPKLNDLTAFNQALCGLYAFGFGVEKAEVQPQIPEKPAVVETIAEAPVAPVASTEPEPVVTATAEPITPSNGDHYTDLEKIFAEAIERARKFDKHDSQKATNEPVVITGASLGLPGTKHVFDDANVGRILRGDQLIGLIPERFRQAMVDKHVTRLVKSDNGGPTFESIGDVADVIKLAGRGGELDLQAEFGVSSERLAALDRVTQLAIASGLEAMRDAGIPLVMRYKTTTKGTQLPDRWGLPDSLRDDTGVIFASAFPGYDAFAEYLCGFYTDRARHEQLALLEDLFSQAQQKNGHSPLGQEISQRIEALRATLEKEPYVFDRKFLFRVLSMGHSQFAEFIGARGPNTQINAACASTSQAIALAEDWIRAGRCTRVIVVSADDATSDNLMEWIGAGFLASGAAATDDAVEEAAIPFDRRRHGLIVGMGAAALIVESADAARERGIQPICEVLSAVTANSAFHGSRLDVQHIGQVMEDLVSQAETHCGISRREIAPKTVFVSHETYTPARGGSASAEIFALRRVFGDAADQIVIANTKGFTGHAMGTGIEEVVAVKALETGQVPPVANFKEIDPALGALNLSKGGSYPVEYALRLGAGFGSQISMALFHWVKTKDGVRKSPDALGYAYRIADANAWNNWLTTIAGVPKAELEVVKRTLRVRDQGPQRKVAPAVTEARAVAVPVPTHPVAATVPAQPAAVEKKPTPVAVTEPVRPVEVAPVVTAPAAPVRVPTTQQSSVKDRILELVVEKTGYPADMLDLDLDMEADLGVDTVKQAEIFAAIREIYNIPRDENRKLRDYPTLSHVIRFVYEKRPDLLEGAVAASKPETPAVQTELPTPVAEIKAPAVVEPPAAVPAISTAEVDSVKDRILALVVDKTGYPQDMLDLDLDMEADLGVDTVKQAEIFTAIREIYSIPRDENRKLRDYPTLAHVIRFVYENRPDLAQKPVAPTVTAATPAATQVSAPPAAKEAVPAASTPGAVSNSDSVKERILALVVEKTGYPQDMLDLDLDLEADLGVDTVKQAEMFAAIREIYNIPRDENRKLRDYPTLAHVIRFVFENRPDLQEGVTQALINTAAASTAVVPPPAPVQEVVATASVAPTPQVDADSVKERILDLVVEKTGYPKDMLDLDLDLEADLGVDTVKQAEMFAAIREIYNIPGDENRKLRDYPTLAHVIRFVFENRPDLKASVTAAAVEVPAAPAVVEEPAVTFAVSSPKVDTQSVKDRILELVVEKTGYPKDMLDLDLDLEADLGVDTVKQAEMFAAIREIYNIPRDENRKLRDYPTLAHVIRFVFENRPDLANTVEPQPTTPVAVAPPEVPKPAPAETVSAAPAAISPDSIRDTVLAIVAEKTGYPPEMLDLDLDLEADLGIDTVKQAEMFAAVRAAYNIPRDETLKLRDFPTLAHVIQFAQKGLEKLAQPAAATSAAAIKSAPPPPPAPTHVTVRPPAASFDAANRIPRRVPVPNLRPPLAICKPTGVKLEPGSRVLIAGDLGGVADTLAEQLRAKGVEVLRITPQSPLEALVAEIESWSTSAPVQGVYWLPALDDEGSLANMDLATWREKLQVRVKAFYAVMRKLYGQVAATGTFLVSATRLGGQHGYDDSGATTPMGGAVTGFTKTYKRERPDVLVKAVDFGVAHNPAEIATLLIDETLRDPGAVEVGYKSGLRWTVGIQEKPANDGQPGLVLNEKSVFVVTGAAGSIVSAITADLAAASGGTFYLLDLVPEPDANNPDIARFTNDRDNLKRDLFARIQARGERATPALVEKELAALERSKAALDAIQAVQAAGGKAHYFSVNLADAAAIAKVIDHVRKTYGRVDVLLHAAGLERSHFLPDKDQREFDLVFDVKADGWFNLLHAIGDMPLGATGAFSSIAGRFGNGGQADYSAANDLLCKYTSSFRTTRPQTRGIVIDWTAWGGIGMATRGSIPKMMELAGIDMLPPEAGIPFIRRELTTGGTRGEVVVGERLGILMNEWDPTGGLEPAVLAASSEKLAHGPMVGTITGMGVYRGLTMETTLDPAAQPFLYDHRIDGTPVLPGVMGIEAFAEAAVCMHPGWHIEAIEEVNFLAPFKFYKDEPRTVTIEALIRPQGDKLVADCRLIGRRKLPNHEQPQETIHFTARVRVSKQPTAAAKGVAPQLSAEAIVEAAHIYRIYFHGPAYQVLDRAWWDGNRMIGEMATGLPGNHKPSDLPTLMAPRLIELCFQTAGIWEMGTSSRMGLPLHLNEVSWLRSPKSAEGRLYAVVTPHPEQGTFDAEVVDSAGNCYVRVGGYRTVALPDGLDAESLKTMRSVVSPEAIAVH